MTPDGNFDVDIVRETIEFLHKVYVIHTGKIRSHLKHLEREKRE